MEVVPAAAGLPGRLWADDRQGRTDVVVHGCTTKAACGARAPITVPWTGQGRDSLDRARARSSGPSCATVPACAGRRSARRSTPSFTSCCRPLCDRSRTSRPCPAPAVTAHLHANRDYRPWRKRSTDATYSTRSPPPAASTDPGRSNLGGPGARTPGSTTTPSSTAAPNAAAPPSRSMAAAIVTAPDSFRPGAACGPR